MGLTRGNSEIIKIFTNRTLNAGALNSINEGFPIGEAYRRLILRLAIALTVGTASGPISEGELNILKGLSFKTSRGWIPYNNVMGRPLFYLDKIKCRTSPVKDAIAATTATYYVNYNLWFADPLMMRPEDTVLDTSMFNRMQLDLLLGTIADLFTTPGTGTIILTADLMAERIRGKLPDKIKPKEYIEIGVPAPVNPANATELNLERSENLAFKRLFVQAANSTTAGVPFSGTPADTVIDSMGVDSDAGEMFNKIPWKILNAEGKAWYRQESANVGYVIFDFCKDGSKMSAILGGLYSRLRLFWDNGTLSTSQVSACYEGMRRVL